VTSTSATDRRGDEIVQSGWQLANYRKNPVVCWAHDYESLPVAKATSVAVEAGRLMVESQFPDLGVSMFADRCAALVETGLLGAVSVGFKPLRWEHMPDGRNTRFLEQELLEISIVPVPVNPEALIEARAAAKRASHNHPGLAARYAELARLRRSTVG
jgi:HK97 family phage prohead protease